MEVKDKETLSMGWKKIIANLEFNIQKNIFQK